MRKLLLLLLLSAACNRESIESRFATGTDLVFRGRYEDAETHFLALVRELADSDEPQDVEWRNRALMQAADIENLYLNDPRRAVARLREVLQHHPNPDLAFEAQEKIAAIFLERLSSCREAAPEIERLVSAFSDRPGSDRWRFRLAQCLFTMEQMERARAEARLLLEKHPLSEYALEAQLLVAGSFYLEKKFAQSAEIHQEILRGSPLAQFRARSLFELGLCQEQLGQMEAAEQSYINALADHPQPHIVKERLLALRKRMQVLPQASGTRKSVTVPPAPAPLSLPPNKTAPITGTEKPQRTEKPKTAPLPDAPQSEAARKPAVEKPQTGESNPAKTEPVESTPPAAQPEKVIIP